MDVVNHPHIEVDGPLPITIASLESLFLDGRLGNVRPSRSSRDRPRKSVRDERPNKTRPSGHASRMCRPFQKHLGLGSAVPKSRPIIPWVPACEDAVRSTRVPQIGVAKNSVVDRARRVVEECIDAFWTSLLLLDRIVAPPDDDELFRCPEVPRRDDAISHWAQRGLA
jgi:hypothetical protein